jgi:hypothetical protein
MVEVNLTAAVLMSIAGAALSVAFTWFPRLNTWYAKLEKDTQSGIMLGLLVLCAVVIVLLGCSGLIVVVGLMCTTQGIVSLALNLLIGLVSGMMSNQGTYGLTKNLAPKAVKAARESRIVKFWHEPKG